MTRTVFLSLSILLNVFFIGLFAGSAFNDNDRKTDKPALPAVDGRALDGRALGGRPLDGRTLFIPLRDTEQLPPEYRQPARDIVREALPDMRAASKDIRRQRAIIREILNPQTYDGDSLEAALNELHRLQGQQVTVMSRSLRQFLDGLPAEDRAIMMESIGENAHRRPHMPRREKADRRHADGPPPERDDAPNTEPAEPN